MAISLECKLAVLESLNTELPYNPEILLLCYVPEKIKNICLHKLLYIDAHSRISPNNPKSHQLMNE